MEERISHENQRPVFLKGLGSSHAILIQTKKLFAILIKSLNGPTKQVSGENARGITICAVRHQNDIVALQFGIFKTNHDAYFAEGWNTHSHGKGVVSAFTHSQRAIRSRRDIGYQVLDFDVGSWKGERFSLSIPQAEAVGLDIPIALQDADPVLLMACEQGNEVGARYQPSNKTQPKERPRSTALSTNSPAIVIFVLNPSSNLWNSLFLSSSGATRF